MTDLSQVWDGLRSTYLRELPDLAYRPVPEPVAIEGSIRELMKVLHSVRTDL